MPRRPPLDDLPVALEVRVDRPQRLETVLVGLRGDLPEGMGDRHSVAGANARDPRVILRDPDPLEKGDEGRTVGLGLLDVEAEEVELVRRPGMGAVPFAHPLREVAQLGALEHGPMAGESLIRRAFASLDVAGRQVHPRPVALHGEGAKAHLLHQEAEDPVLQDVEAARGVIVLAQGNHRGLADHPAQRFQIVRGERGVVAVQPPDPRHHRIARRRTGSLDLKVRREGLGPGG